MQILPLKNLPISFIWFLFRLWTYIGKLGTLRKILVRGGWDETTKKRTNFYSFSVGFEPELRECWRLHAACVSWDENSENFGWEVNESEDIEVKRQEEREEDRFKEEEEEILREFFIIIILFVGPERSFASPVTDGIRIICFLHKGIYQLKLRPHFTVSQRIIAIKCNILRVISFPTLQNVCSFSPANLLNWSFWDNSEASGPFDSIAKTFAYFLFVF